MSKRWTCVLPGLALAALLLASSVQASEEPATTQDNPQATVAATAAEPSAEPAPETPAAGLQMVIDAETGAARVPTDAELEDLLRERGEQAPAGDEPELRVETAEDGTLTAFLDDRYERSSAAFATLGPDGKLIVEHHVDAAAREAAARAEASAEPATTEATTEPASSENGGQP